MTKLKKFDKNQEFFRNFKYIYQKNRCMDDDDPKIFCLQNNLLEKADKDFGVLPTIIALLMGFYVNLVSVRWWDQVDDGKLEKF